MEFSFSSSGETDLNLMSQRTYDNIREILPQNSQELNEYAAVPNYTDVLPLLKIEQETFYEFNQNPQVPLLQPPPVPSSNIYSPSPAEVLLSPNETQKYTIEPSYVPLQCQYVQQDFSPMSAQSAIYGCYPPLQRQEQQQKQPISLKSLLLIENSSESSYVGRYNFCLHFDKEEKPPTKSCIFTYSEKLKHLFVQKGYNIKIKFTTAVEVPNDAEVRACLLFKNECYQNIWVKQCPFHLEETKDPANKHFIMQATENGENIQCPVTGRCIIISKLSTSNKLTTKEFFVSYHFSCNSSCKGGINRKPIFAVFALYVRGKQVGKQNLDLSICTCPGRDKRNAEAKGEKEVQVPVKDEKAVKEDLEPPKKKYKMAQERIIERISIGKEDEDDDNIYHIKVKGKKDSLFIKRLADMISVMNQIDESLVEEIKARTMPMLLSNKGMRPFSQRKTHLLKFEKVKKKYNISPTVLERSLSTPLHSKPVYKKVTVRIQQPDMQ